MSYEDGEESNRKTDIDDLIKKTSPRLLMLVGGGALLTVLFAIFSLLMMVSLSSDMSTLQDQIRKAGKTAKAMQEEMAELRTLLAPVTAAKRAEGAQPQSATGMLPTPASIAPGVATSDKQVRIDTGASSRDCTVTAGNTTGLAGCLKLATPAS